MPDPLLQPGRHLSPLVQLQRLQGDADHMHIAQLKYREADSKLFFCSYTFGMIDASDPQDMSYEVQGLKHVTPSGSNRDPGCLHLAWDEDDLDLVYTSHRGNIDFAVFLSGWDLTDPDAPVQLPALQEPGVAYGGIDVENGLIYVALQTGGLGIYDYDAGTGWTNISTASGLNNAWNVQVIGDIAYVADGTGGLATVDVSDPLAPSFIARVVFGGNAEDLVVADGVAYVAAGSGGLVLVDVSDPAAPSVLSDVPTPGSAVGVAYSAGRAYVAAWNDTRIYDVSDPASPAFIAALRLTIEQGYETCSGDPEVCVPDTQRPDPTARTLHVAASGDDMFVGNWWVPYSFRVHADRSAPSIVLPEDVARIDLGPTEVGDTNTRELSVKNEGNAALTLFDNWVDNEAFAVSPAQVRIEPGESAELTLSYTATVTTSETAVLQLWSDDPQQPIRSAYLVGNQPGLGVGQPLPDTEVTLLDGSTLSTAPLIGNVMVLAYFATF
ncbi:Ig-like domain-containing protein [Enhygromyxa salina]|nr:alkyl hydroperoxide reductase [Enhygromyxa salina]